MKTKKTTKKQSGQALVEFAIITPVLLALVMGMIEWGFLLWTKNTFTNAVRDGARTAVVIQNWPSNQSTNENEVRQVVLDRVQTLPSAFRTGINSRITIQPLPGASNVQSIRVSIDSQPYDPLIDFARPFVPATVSASAEFRFEGIR